jgi:hypothetical protein
MVWYARMVCRSDGCAQADRLFDHDASPLGTTLNLH